MKRRTFIYTGFALIALLGLGDIFLVNYGSRGKRRPFFYPLILSGILDEERLRIIGNSYRSMRPDENSEANLLNSIKSRIPAMHDKMYDASNQALEIEKAVETDFRTSKLIVIKGWLLSETEARQCALLSLS